MMNRQLEKYLRTRGVQDRWALSGSERRDFRAVVVIPSLAEADFLPQTLNTLACNPTDLLRQTLILIVVNNREDASGEQRDDNCETLSWLRSHPLDRLNLAWIDACSPGLELPPKEGVGLARKIGFDLALCHLDWRKSPILVSLDADTLVDADYLPAIFRHFSGSPFGGAVLPFRHQAAEDRQQEQSIRRYELYLRSYLFGLSEAGSPYAYHTIGSAFACRGEAYVVAGGMNRRSAAEDFYFLQQLAKTSGVAMLKGTIVRPSPRCSTRVPFGTGRVVEAEAESGEQLYRFISVEAFSVLQDWLGLVEAHPDSSGRELFDGAERLSPRLSLFLDELDFIAVWERLCKNHKGLEQRKNAFHRWFDALRTRQMLGRVDSCHRRPAKEIVAELLSWGGLAASHDENGQLALLGKVQN